MNGNNPHALDYRDVFDQRGGHWTEDVEARPVSPGAPALDLGVLRAQPGRWDGHSGIDCALCRQGNAIVPDIHLVGGNRRTLGNYRLDPDATHLYLGDTEIPSTSVSGKPGYELPPERHTYRLVTDFDNRGFGQTHADWTFSSAAPEHDETQPGTVCPLAKDDLSDEPCRADPLVFLSYDLDVALDNTLATPSVGRFTVTAYHQAVDAPAIRELKVWTSTDDGEHWKRALVLPRDHGADAARSFVVITAVPGLSQTPAR